MDGSLVRAGRLCIAILVCTLITSGCAQWRMPRIDPSGRRIFLPGQSYRPLGADVAPAPPPVIGPPVVGPPVIGPPVIGPPVIGPSAVGPPVFGVPAQVPLAGRAALDSQRGVSILPGLLVAPIGSEVVIVADVPGRRGFVTAGDRVEWTLAPGGVGQLVSVGGGSWFDQFRLPVNRPGKVSGGYAIGATSGSGFRITRGTVDVGDDVFIQRGQAWVTVTSAVEGTSYLSALAPLVRAWDRRQASAIIHWIDAQWTFPPPAVNPVGKRHTFTTTVTRQSDGSPVVGWHVRYEIVGGPPAGFGPEGVQVIEVATNELGQASVEISQSSEGDARPASGTSQIGIQIIRSPLGGDDSGRLLLGSGTTTKTWSAPIVALRTTGPDQSTLSATITYVIDVSNPGDLPVTGAVVTEEVPEGLTYVRSNPAGTLSGRNLRWDLGSLRPGETRSIELVYRADRAGTINRCAKVRTAEGLSAEDCTTASIVTQALDVQITGPTTAEVGMSVEFTAVVTNLSDAPATGLTITDRFDPGLAHSVAEDRIEGELGDIAAGESRKFFISFTVTQPGQLCHTVEVVGAGGARGSRRACLTATRPAPASQPGLEVTKTGPKQTRVGETAEFFVDIKNTGNVPLTNVRIADRFPRGLEPDMATDDFTVGEGELVWTLARLEPGQTYRLRVQCKCTVSQLRACNQVTVTCDQRPPIADEACVEVLPALERPAPTGKGRGDAEQPRSETPDRPAVRPEGGAPKETGPDTGDASGPGETGTSDTGTGEAGPGELPAEGGTPDTGGGQRDASDGPPSSTDAKRPATPSNLRLSIAELGDPVRVGGLVIYQLIIENKGEMSDHDVTLVVTFDERITPGQITTPGNRQWEVVDQTIRFEPIAEFRAGETVNYRIPFQAHEAGGTTIVAELASGRLRQPLRVEEKTSILAP